MPSAAQRLIKLHDAEDFLQAQARKLELSLKEIAIRIECVQLVIDTAAVPKIRETEPVLQSLLQCLLLRAALAEAPMGGEGVGGLGECSLDRPLVVNQRSVVRSDRTSFKDC